MEKQKRKQRSKRTRKKKAAPLPMLFTAWNYKWLVAGITSVLVGFGGMYIESQQFGFFSLYVGPVLVLAGFVVVAYAVFKTDPSLIEDNTQTSADSPQD